MEKKTIRLTDKMAEALSNTIEISGRQTMIMSHPRTRDALTRVGLADEHDRLTDSGLFVAWLISSGTKNRAWTHQELVVGARTWREGRECDRWPNRLTLEEAWAEFERDWLRDFRGHVVRVQFPEPDRDAGRLTLEEALEEAQTAGLMGELSVVRIAYADGTTEECRNIPRGEIAAGIFAEAVYNDRVVKAELVRGDGSVAAQYPREPMPRARPVDGTCGRHMSESVARAYGWKSLAACARVPGHLGRHRDTRGIAPLTMHWGVNETAPLDPTP